MKKETIEVCLQLLSQVQVNPMQEGADSAWQKVVNAREDLKQEAAKFSLPEEKDLPKDVVAQ